MTDKCNHVWQDIGDDFSKCRQCGTVSQSRYVVATKPKDTTCPLCYGLAKNRKGFLDETCPGCHKTSKELTYEPPKSYMGYPLEYTIGVDLANGSDKSVRSTKPVITEDDLAGYLNEDISLLTWEDLP